MKKKLTADFSKGNEKAYVRGLYQHDYGAILKVTGIEYAEIIRVDFAGPNDGKAHPVVALQEPDGGFQVKIPKENTDKAGELSAYIYITDAESGFTIKEVILPIIERVEADPDPLRRKKQILFADDNRRIKEKCKNPPAIQRLPRQNLKSQHLNPPHSRKIRCAVPGICRSRCYIGKGCRNVSYGRRRI